MISLHIPWVWWMEMVELAAFLESTLILSIRGDFPSSIGTWTQAATAMAAGK
jgi:hypothetical protein